jgi:hypothetical protein
MGRFDRLSPEPMPSIPDGVLEKVELKTARQLERERLEFKADRYGHNDPSSVEPSLSRIAYMAHAKGYVMARRPGCKPFVIDEKLWRSFPKWEGQGD